MALTDTADRDYISASGRPLPQPTLSSSEFWRSGADGLLRIARCRECSAWAHPRPARCPECGSRELDMTVTSGRGHIIGFTINHQQWLPSMPPPYVVAVVALAEDPAIRLTTNIVGCVPGEVAIGKSVHVVFEHAATDIWIPLFELDAEQDQAPLPAPDAYRKFLRPPAAVEKFEDRVAISGVGQSRVGRRLMVDPLSLTVDACLAAVADAGLELDQIDGMATYPGPTANGMSEGGIMAVEDALRLHPVWVNGGADLPGQNGSIIAAMLAVASGLCRHVLCFRTVWESSYSTLVQHGKWMPDRARATGMFEYRAPFGAMSAANWIACQASQYLDRYNVSRDVLGWISVTERDNAADNPEAVYRDPITIDDYLAARPISTPFGLYDCDIPVDGAVAVVVSHIDTVADMPRTPVLVEAVGTQVMERLSWDQGTMDHLPQSLGPAAHLWSRTALRPEDVDVALLYDGFTFNALSWLEGLGFCGFGEAADFIDSGRGIAVNGPLPVNPHGGQLSAGRTHGYGFVREAVLQLRGQAPGRQVRDPKVAVVTAGGGVPSGAMLLRVP